MKTKKNVNYFITIEYDDKIMTYDIYIGYPLEKHCVKITVYSDYACLDGVITNSSCFIGKNKPSENENMIVDLIQCGLNFTIKLFPSIQYITLIDNSTLTCYKYEKISLADLFYIKHNKTWYQKNFGAKNTDKNNIKLREKMLKNKLQKKIKLSVDEFNQKYLSHLKIKDNINDETKSNIQELFSIYKPNMTVFDYLDKVIPYNNCLIYYKFFINFIGNNLFGSSWIIKINTIKLYDVFYKIHKVESPIMNIRKQYNKLINIRYENNKKGIRKKYIMKGLFF